MREPCLCKQSSMFTYMHALNYAVREKRRAKIIYTKASSNICSLQTHTHTPIVSHRSKHVWCMRVYICPCVCVSVCGYIRCIWCIQLFASISFHVPIQIIYACNMTIWLGLPPSLLFAIKMVSCMKRTTRWVMWIMSAAEMQVLRLRTLSQSLSSFQATGAASGRASVRGEVTCQTCTYDCTKKRRKKYTFASSYGDTNMS